MLFKSGVRVCEEKGKTEARRRQQEQHERVRECVRVREV